MTKRIGLTIVVIALGFAVVADAGQGTGKISGIARDAQNHVLSGVKVQLRNVDMGQLVATTKAGADGAFEFTGLNPGNYIAEIVDNSGKIIGLSPSTALAAGEAITGLVVAASTSGALAGTTAAGGGTGFFSSTGIILLLAAISAGVATTVVAAANEASPSR